MPAATWMLSGAMNYGSVCSGIEAASCAWEPLGWQAQFFSEIEAFPSAVLAHHHPDVPNYGDMTQHKEWPDAAIDVLVGGTPCQSFSVAGLREGLRDPRGNLALVYLALVNRMRPRWFIWENVPGVLSSDEGRDFGAFLGAVGQLGYGFAYRVLDAQYYGVAQRRRRVFVVGYLGDWRPPAAVLFEPESLRGDSAPRRESRKVAPAITSNSTGAGGPRGDFHYDGGLATYQEASTGEISHCLNAGGMWRQDYESETIVHMRTFSGNQESPVAGTLETTCHDYSRADSFNVAVGFQVRRLTPTECERLQGFPDGFTQIPYRNKPADKCPDEPRYKALGNSMAVPVMRWIGERIEFIESLKEAAA